ncbi:MAG TPA: apolipoprotein N-acyltransferase [Frankiaceae bacterium]|jgi:apolipoprotein N-acyltransferase|nr:apolipoprotein N-acyltransferase [Frankiaceae bacterium]
MATEASLVRQDVPVTVTTASTAPPQGARTLAESDADPGDAAPGGQGGPAAPRRRGFRRFVPTRRALAAALVGLITCFAFPPWGFWPLAFLGVAGLAILVRDRRCKTAYGLGIAYALGFLLPLLVWSKVAGVDAWIILTVSQSLLLAIIGPLCVLAQRRRFAPLWIAGAWMVEEAIRDRVPFGGFPWGRLAFSQSDSPLTALAAWGGAPLLTFAVALGGGLLVVAVRTLRGAAAGPRAGFTAGAALAGLLAITFGPLLIPRPTAAQRGNAVVAAIQGNVPRTGLDALGQKRAVTRNHVAETERLAAQVKAGKVPAPDLVLWPENSSDLDPFQDATAAQLLDTASAAIGRPILVGAVLDGPGAGHVRNTGLLWGPTGYLGQMYIKRHPVPFAEYLPGRSIIQKIVTRYAHDQPNDFVAGKTAGLFTIQGPKQSYRLGDVICFEVAYDGLVRSVVDKGAQLIVVQTNNASFGRSGETYQQLAMGRIRAVEHGRTVVVAATSGLSAIISPNGSLLQRSSLFTAQSLVASVPLRSSLTLADRLGGWTELVLVALGTLGLLSAVQWRRTRGYRVVGRLRRDRPQQ